MKKVKVDRFLARAAVLCGEPLTGYSPDEIRKWLQDHGQTDHAIAEAMRAVDSKTGWLHHEINDPDNDEKTIETYHKEYDEWWALYKELVFEIIRRMDEQKCASSTDHTAERKGWRYIIEPFMVQNGFCDGAGWWVKDV